MPADVKTISSLCRSVLKLKDARLPPEYYYRSLPLCAIDAVFSIGVKYEGVRNAVRRYAEAFGLDIYRPTEAYPERGDQQSVEDFLRKADALGTGYLAESVFRNRQRTSTRNGILKAEAVYRFCQVLRRHGVNVFQDLQPALSNPALEEAVREIPGQRSGISFIYFCMLAGEEQGIKPDRMVIRFLEQALGRTVKIGEAQQLLTAVSETLRAEYPHLTPRLLDYEIWSYTRSQGKKR